MPRAVDRDTRGALLTAVFRIQKALAKFTMQLGMSAGEMNELVRRAHVEAAEELARAEGGKVHTTKLCAMTGLYRKEIIRLRNLPPLTSPSLDERYNRTARVVTGWIRDPEFHTKAGKPAALPFQGPASFSELVRRYSGDMAPIAMQQELERLGVVSTTKKGLIRLDTSGYLTTTNIDALQILGTDTSDLIDTINHNVNGAKEERRFQRKVSYVNLPHRYTEPFRQYAAQESQKLLEKLDKWLARHDKKDSSDSSRGSRIGLGIYHFEKPSSVQDSGKDETSDG
jgi:hypothetical protein